MKKVLLVLLTLFLTLTVSGCDKGTDSVDISQLPEIMMIKVNTNYAWGRHQSIVVIDRDGNCYSQSVNSNDDEKPSGWVEFSEDGWYERLLEIKENGEPNGSLTADTLESVRKNAKYFAEWSALPVKEYETQMFDYGSVTLYGVYFDVGGELRHAMIATAGDVPYCREDAGVMKFVNRTGLLDFNFT